MTESLGPPPKSDVSKVEAVEGGIRVVHEYINHQGQAYRAEFTAKVDGRDYPWKGTFDGKPVTIQDTGALQRKRKPEKQVDQAGAQWRTV